MSIKFQSEKAVLAHLGVEVVLHKRIKFETHSEPKDDFVTDQFVKQFFTGTEEEFKHHMKWLKDLGATKIEVKDV